MRFIPLYGILLYLSCMSAFGQLKSSTDSLSTYTPKKLNLDEVNFVTGYYHQNGNNSAVTGGVGTERLSDFANTIDVSLSKFDSRSRKHTLGFQLGVDTYSSASSDKIDPNTVSSASKSDMRVYPSASWTVSNEEKGRSVGVNLSSSFEFDYTSFGGGFNFTQQSKNKNREFGIKLQAFFDTWKVILPIELRSPGLNNEYQEGDRAPRNSYDLGLSYMQVINKNLQALLLVEPAYQHGLLATKYQRVFFNNDAELSETLPSDRYKLPIGLRLNYFAGDRFIFRTLYRYYADSWGIRAHTADLEIPVKITPFVSISPFYRYYNQNAADYFAGYRVHSPSESYFTSDYDLSAFSSNFYGTGIRLAPPKGIINSHLTMLELRYGHYSRSNGLGSNIVSMNLRFK